MTRYPARDDWMRGKWFLFTMEYYSAMKKNSLAIHNNVVGTGGHDAK